MPVADIADAAYVFSHKAPGQNIELTIAWAGIEQKYNFKLSSKPLDVSFRMVDEQEVNAGAMPNLIVVTLRPDAVYQKRRRGGRGLRP